MHGLDAVSLQIKQRIFNLFSDSASGNVGMQAGCGAVADAALGFNGMYTGNVLASICRDYIIAGKEHHRYTVITDHIADKFIFGGDFAVDAHFNH